MKLGDFNKLTVVKRVDFGVYLDGGREGEILLPAKYVPEGTQIGDELDVFLYLDQEERLIATTETPICRVGDFAFLKVAWVNQYGTFLNWGLPKDLFCPFREQKQRMVAGRSYIVYVHIDSETYRIVATAKVERYLNRTEPQYKRGQEVDLLIWQKTDLGFKVIVDNKFSGLIYDDHIFKDIRTGDRVKGYIDQLRPDGKLDVTLQPTGRRQTLTFSETLLDYLKEHDGYCPLGDKSDAEDIKEMFQVSKKTFKRATSHLYAQRLITINDTSMRLVDNE